MSCRPSTHVLANAAQEKDILPAIDRTHLTSRAVNAGHASH
jgi:hypothetical protein